MIEDLCGRTARIGETPVCCVEIQVIAIGARHVASRAKYRGPRLQSVYRMNPVYPMEAVLGMRFWLPLPVKSA